MAKVASGTIATVGVGPVFTVQPAEPFDVSVTAITGGSIQLERSLDQGLTWAPVTGNIFTSPGGTEVTDKVGGAQFRMNMTAGTNGTYEIYQ